MTTRRSGMTRRQLGLVTAGAALTACTGDQVDEPIITPPPSPGPEPAQPWVPAGAVDDAAFPGGVRVGDAWSNEAILAGQSSEVLVNVTLAVGTAEGWQEMATLTDVEVVGGVVHAVLAGLTADHSYAVALFSQDGSRRSSVARFRSALAPEASRPIRFGATSCLAGNQPWPSLSHAAAERFDFFLLLGDTIYADFGANQFDYELKWREAVAVQGLRDVAASTSLIATWDDHEVDNNWSWDSPGVASLFNEGLSAFRRYLPQRIGPASQSGSTGIWRKLSWGQALDVLVLDCRGERRDGNYLSAEQMSWLKEELSASTARFKVIMNSVPIIDFTGTLVGNAQAEDRWQGFPAQRSELTEHIINNGIGGVLFVSGDFHIGGAAFIDPAGNPAEAVMEVLAGPGGSEINPFVDAISTSERIPSIVKQHNYTLFEADPETGVISVRFIGDDGGVIDELSLQL